SSYKLRRGDRHARQSEVSAQLLRCFATMVDDLFEQLLERHSLHANLPSCSRTTASSRADSSSAAVSSFVSRSIFSSIGSSSSSASGAPTNRPGVTAQPACSISSIVADLQKPGTSSYSPSAEARPRQVRKVLAMVWMSWSEKVRSTRSTMYPISRASMNSTSRLRSIDPFDPAVLSFAKNHTHTGIATERHRFGGIATTAETTPAFSMFLRISPSPPVFEAMVPLAITTAASPWAESLERMCCIQAKLALRTGGTS